MSAVSSVKLKANCNAVSSGSLINQAVVNSSIVEKSSLNSVKTSLNSNQNNNNNIINNGTNLNQYHHQQQLSSIKFEPVNETSFVVVHNQEQQDCISDVQKVLKQEQELQKQLYSGPNVAPGWLRVNHNNKVIYIR
jgi:hypothetical protein